MNLNEELVHFVIGSSMFIVIYPLIYFYYTYSKMTELEKHALSISLESLLLFLPIVYGVLFALLYSVLSIIPRKYDTFYIRFSVCGALAAVCVSLVLHYGFNVYEEWLECDSPEMCHVGVFSFYLILYLTIGTWLRTQLLYGPQTSTPSTSPSVISSPIVSSYKSSTLPMIPPAGNSLKSSSSAGVFDSLQKKSQTN